MPRFEVAHIKEQGVNLLIVPLASTFGRLSSTEQNARTRQLQIRANAAGLAGTVVTVWDAGDSRMGFLAPTGYFPFLSGLSLSHVQQSLNKEISW
jgi:hypothetical protein